MKRNALIAANLLLLLLFISSCSNESSTEMQSSTSSVNIIAPAVNSGNFEIGPFGGLGYGYDVTGEYANANSSRLQVIDMEKFNSDLPDRIYFGWPHSGEYRMDEAENAEEFSKIFSDKLDITTGKYMFKNTLLSNFSTVMTNNNKFDGKYIYASCNIKIVNKFYAIDAIESQLMNYLTPKFLQDLESNSPEEIVKDYGTHVMKKISLGAKMEILYQAETTNKDRKAAALGGIQSAMAIVFGNGMFGDEYAGVTGKNFSQRLSFKSIGGSKILNGYLNLDQPNPKFNTSDWQSSSNLNNSYLVDFDSNGLIYIYDLVSDPIKKAALKAYIDQYLIDNKVTIN